MVRGWCGILSCRSWTVMPSRIDVCFCVSQFQRTSSLGSYCREPWLGLPCLRSSRYARAISIVQQGSFDMDAAVVSRLRDMEEGRGQRPVGWTRSSAPRKAR